MGDLVGLTAVLLIFGTPIIAILSTHHRKLVEIKARMKARLDQEVKAEIQALRQEIMELRDTTSQYDIGFDNSLKQLETQVQQMDQRVRRLENTSWTTGGAK